MTLWLIMALLALLTVGLLLLPLFRRRNAVGSRGEHEFAVHRDRLRELRRETERGLLSDAEAKAAETEISRHLLAAARSSEEEDAARQERAAASFLRGLVTALLAVAVPAGAFGVYLLLGSPDAPSHPFAARQVEREALSEHQGIDMETAIATLVQRLEADPQNLDGWILLARSYDASARHKEAAQAYRRALELQPDNLDLAGTYAESLVRAARGMVTPESAQIFHQLLSRVPKDPRSRYYLALAKAQAGDGSGAIEAWQALAADGPPDAPWLPAVQTQIARAAQEFGIEVAELPPAAASPATAPPAGGDVGPGPSAEDVEAARTMPPAAQLEMIRGMVARLAERLAEDPEDVEGWLRLARSYQVLGEPAEARKAVQEARARSADATPETREAIEALAGELGVGGKPAGSSEAQ
jgi:cytochrome c-type biogenesis protein CcmH